MPEPVELTLGIRRCPLRIQNLPESSSEKEDFRIKQRKKIRILTDKGQNPVFIVYSKDRK